MIQSSEIQALIQLIEDPDETIFAQVRHKLHSFGSEVIPILKNNQLIQLTETYGDLYHQRIEGLIHDIHFEEVKRELSDWISSDEKDLLEGAFIIAKYKYPNLDCSYFKAFIQEMSVRVWKKLSPVSTAFEKVKMLNQVLFEEYQFHNNQHHYFSPLNSYLNTALELREGNPLSLGIIYSALANQLSIPIYGVNLPNHFVVAYMDELNVNLLIGNTNQYGVLFYINPYNKGEILSVKSIQNYLQTLHLEPRNNYFEPCSNSTILIRMLSNLINVYSKLKRKRRVDELNELKQLFS